MEFRYFDIRHKSRDSGVSHDKLFFSDHIVKQEVYTGEDDEAISKHSGGSTYKTKETRLGICTT